MACYIQFGLDSGAQTECMTLLADQKVAVIQTANGLCARASQSEIVALLSGISGLTVRDIQEQDELTPDVAHFLSQDH